jgi:hypothetical protein
MEIPSTYPSDRPSITDITRGATSTPIYFDGEEEEEMLPTNLHQPIPDDDQNI